MSRFVLPAAGLAAVYLLVLTSLAPADVAAAALLGVAVTVGIRPHRPPRSGARLRSRFLALGAELCATVAETARGSWRVVRFCLGAPAHPGLVEIPRGERSDLNVALWGVLTGESPDDILVDVDDERGVLIVHVLDDRDPDAIRERHRAREARQRRVVG